MKKRDDCVINPNYTTTINFLLSAFIGYTIDFKKGYYVKNKKAVAKFKEGNTSISNDGSTSTITIVFPEKISNKKIVASSMTVSLEEKYLIEFKLFNGNQEIFCYSYKEYLKDKNNQKNLNIIIDKIKGLLDNPIPGFNFADTMEKQIFDILISCFKPENVNSKHEEMMPEHKGVSGVPSDGNATGLLSSTSYLRVRKPDTDMEINFLKLLLPSDKIDIDVIDYEQGYVIKDKNNNIIIQITENVLFIPPHIEIRGVGNGLPEIRITDGTDNFSLIYDGEYYNIKLASQINSELLKTQLKHFECINNSSLQQVINAIKEYIYSNDFRELVLKSLKSNISTTLCDQNSFDDYCCELLLDTLLIFSRAWANARNYSLDEILSYLLGRVLGRQINSRFKNIMLPGLAEISFLYPYSFGIENNDPTYLIDISPMKFNISKIKPINSGGCSESACKIEVSYPMAKLFIPLPDGTCFISVENGDGMYKIVRDMSAEPYFYEEIKKEAGLQQGWSCTTVYRGKTFSDIESYIEYRRNENNDYIKRIEEDLLKNYLGRTISEVELNSIRKQFAMKCQESLSSSAQNNVYKKELYPFRILNLIFSEKVGISIEVIDEIKNGEVKYRFNVSSENLESLEEKDKAIFDQHIDFFRNYLKKEFTEDEADEIILSYITSDLFKDYAKCLIEELFKSGNSNNRYIVQESCESDYKKMLLLFVSMTSSWYRVFHHNIGGFSYRFRAIENTNIENVDDN